MSNVFWVACIAVNFFFCIKNAESRFFFTRYKRYFQIVCWGIPLIFSVALLITDINYQYQIIGNVQLWCWIKSEFSLFRLIFFYIWIIIGVIICFLLYIYTCISIRDQQVFAVLKYKFAAYMCTFVITNIFSLINRIYDAAQPNNPSSALVILQVATSPTQGIWLYIVFIYYYNRFLEPSLESSESSEASKPLLPKDNK